MRGASLHEEELDSHGRLRVDAVDGRDQGVETLLERHRLVRPITVGQVGAVLDHRRLHLDVPGAIPVRPRALLIPLVDGQGLQASNLALQLLLAEDGLDQGDLGPLPLDLQARVGERDRRLEADQVLLKGADGAPVLCERERRLRRVRRLVREDEHDVARRAARALGQLALDAVGALQRLTEGELEGLGTRGGGGGGGVLGFHFFSTF